MREIKMRTHVEKKRLLLDDFFKIEEAYVSYEAFDGRMSGPVRRLNFERGDAVAVLIFNRDSQQAVLINQFRYPTMEKTGGWIWETVAGMIEPGEKPGDTICREILEEVGYRVSENQLIPIASFYPSPGGSSERIFLYYTEVTADNKVAGGGGVASENEDIQVIGFSLKELWDAVDSGKIHDAKTLIALLWLKNRKNECTG